MAWLTAPDGTMHWVLGTHDAAMAKMRVGSAFCKADVELAHSRIVGPYCPRCFATRYRPTGGKP